MRFIFKEHLVQVKEAIQNPSLVEKQYTNLSKDTGFTFLPSESYLDWMGNFCIEREQLNSAITFFELAKTYYPDSSNAYLSIGKAYEKKGEKSHAKLYYEQALKLSPNNTEIKTLLEFK